MALYDSYAVTTPKRRVSILGHFSRCSSRRYPTACRYETNGVAELIGQGFKGARVHSSSRSHDSRALYNKENGRFSCSYSVLNKSAIVLFCRGLTRTTSGQPCVDIVKWLPYEFSSSARKTNDLE